jgi:hypothetical protein
MKIWLSEIKARSNWGKSDDDNDDDDDKSVEIEIEWMEKNGEKS